MLSIVIIGSGNVAHHLIKAISKSNKLEIKQVYARNKVNVIDVIDENKITNDVSQLKEADLYLISVSDAAVAEVSNKLMLENKLIAHTSGSLDMNVLDSKNRKGVFYPLQTFSKKKDVNFHEIPICLEAQNEKDYEVLETVAKNISNVVYSINSQQRKALHVSAVFVSNFVNHLYKIGNDICDENKIPFQILLPLIQETAQKINYLPPVAAQTGPAVRNDIEITQLHEAFLSDESQKKIYQLLTQSIQNNVKKL
jgi:predicted short-subunit dehydrogenase-like oxidoreductase (DUF2520 family)